MSTSKILFVAAALALVSNLSAAMNNADLIKLKKVGLSDENILLAIAREPAAYDTTPSGLVELKEADVSEAIIKKLMALTAAEQEEEANSTADRLPGTALVGAVFDREMPSVSPAFVSPLIGQDYFTRFTFHQEHKTHPSTNYARGRLVPINTPVKLLALEKDELVIQRLDTGEEIKIANIEKYSRKSLTELARLMFSAKKTPLERLPDEVAAAIRNGEMRRGMTKEQVIMARGYPPAHETPSSESDRWVYWTSRFFKQTVTFENGRLTDGEGVY